MAKLHAVIFDVDGTMADTERHGHRVAFNKAFERLSLPDRWDEELYGKLLRVAGGERRLRSYFEEIRGLPPERCAELAAQLHRMKTQIFTEVVASGSIPARSGVRRLIDEILDEGLRVAVATTGSRSWVVVLLERLLGRERLSRIDPIVTGDEAPQLKPHPDAYLLALRDLGMRASDVVAIEDSANGVRAANAAGIPCLAVVGDYTPPDALSDAALGVDGFGDAEHPAHAFHDPLQVGVHDVVTVDVLRRLHALASESSSVPSQP